MFGAYCAVAFVAACVFAVVLVVLVRTRRRDERQRAALLARYRALESAYEDASHTAEERDVERAWYYDLFQATDRIVLCYGVAKDDLPSCFIDANQAACDALEYSRDELRELKPLDVEMFRKPGSEQGYVDVELVSLSNEEELGRDSAFAVHNMQAVIRRVRRDGEFSYQGGYVTRSGKRLPVEITAVRRTRGGVDVIACTARDTSWERKRDQEVRESRQKFEEIFTNSRVGLGLYDDQRNIVSANKALLNMFGCPELAEFAKFDMFDNPFLAPDARQLARQGVTRSEMVVDFDEVLNKSLFLSSRHGKAYFDLGITSLGVDEDYNARGFLVQVSDITERRETESALQESEKALRQAQKLEAIGALAGGIAHDFNNILTPILGYADMGLDMCDEGDTIHEFLQEIRMSTRRAKELVGQILTFSRQTESVNHPIRITPIVKEIVKQLGTSIPSNIDINCLVRTEHDLVMANPTQIHQILMNLSTNAVYQMREGGGKLDVMLMSFVLGSRHKREFPQLATHEYLRKGHRRRYLRLSVKDTGPGIDAVTMERIFEPFFTTKPSGEGTGMGLAVVHGIVSSLGGAISVESDPGSRTVFHVVLPSVRQEVERVEERTVAPSARNECILFVDDEVGIIKMAEHMLQSLGFRPVVTNQSAKALELCKRDPNRFDMVITDQVMPEMTGAELARELLSLRPDLPVVLCTGFSESLSANEAKACGVREVVMKPIERVELAAAIQRALDPPLPPTGMSPLAEASTGDASRPEPEMAPQWDSEPSLSNT